MPLGATVVAYVDNATANDPQWAQIGETAASVPTTAVLDVTETLVWYRPCPASDPKSR